MDKALKQRFKRQKELRDRLDAKKPPPRTHEEINIEYSKICAEIGQAQYQIAKMSAQMEVRLRRMRDLEAESAQLKATQAKEQPIQGVTDANV